MIGGTSVSRGTAIPTRLLRSLSDLCEGHDMIVGAIATSLETSLDSWDSSIDKLAILRSCPSRLERLRGSYPTNLVRLIDGTDDYLATRNLMKRARRRKEGTCLAVMSNQRTSVILNQLHLHHQFVLVPWPERLDKFTTGLIKNAQQNGSQVIADGISDDYQVMTALALGVQVGTVTNISNLSACPTARSEESSMTLR